MPPRRSARKAAADATAATSATVDDVSTDSAPAPSTTVKKPTSKAKPRSTKRALSDADDDRKKPTSKRAKKGKDTDVSDTQDQNPPAKMVCVILIICLS